MVSKVLRNKPPFAVFVSAVQVVSKKSFSVSNVLAVVVKIYLSRLFRLTISARKKFITLTVNYLVGNDAISLAFKDELLNVIVPLNIL